MLNKNSIVTSALVLLSLSTGISAEQLSESIDCERNDCNRSGCVIANARKGIVKNKNEYPTVVLIPSAIDAMENAIECGISASSYIYIPSKHDALHVLQKVCAELSVGKIPSTTTKVTCLLQASETDVPDIDR